MLASNKGTLLDAKLTEIINLRSKILRSCGFESFYIQ